MGERRESVSPHRVDMGAQLGQILRIQSKVVTRAAAFFFHQPGGLEHLQMLRHCGPAYGQAAGEFSDR